MKLRQTAIEQESLQASYSFLLLVAIFGLETPFYTRGARFITFSVVVRKM